MKTTLKKILLISLFFSVAVPSAMQADLLNLAALRSKGMVSWLCTNGGNFCSFLRKNPIAMQIAVLGTIVGTVFVWNVLKEKKARKKAATDDLLIAAKNNDTVKVKQALASGADINNQDKHGYTALMRAADRGNLTVVKLLLKNNANTSKQNASGYTALMLAIVNGYIDLVESLLETKKVDINQRTYFGYTALMLAASKGDSEGVELLLANGAGAKIDQRDHYGWTVLMLAADREKFSDNEQEFTNIIEQLLAAGADPLLRGATHPVARRAYDATILEQGNNETIKEYRRKRISGILKEEVASKLSLELPDDLAILISEFTYNSLPECEPVQ